ncbi:MAG: sporulation protein [candidate division Zixibacteria bacterium CG_4_9_14_3_um_filter_46_8]|nr:MAG: sporulation protein [candidate division Zixibacteria bacterium CG_4_9_14_3_um_filter_46_8]
MANQVEEIMRAIVGELKSMAHSETIIGKPITIGEKLVVPICKISVGFGAGGGEGEQKEGTKGFGGGGGGGAFIEPVAFIVIVGERVSLLPVRPGRIGEIIDMIPNLFETIKGLKGTDKKAKNKDRSGSDE